MKAVLGDPAARMLHGSAQGLLGFVALRARPDERFRELARTLAESPAPTHQDFTDYLNLWERGVGSTGMTAFRAAGPARELLTREAIAWARTAPDDVNAAEALARAVDGWRRACGSPLSDPDLPRLAFTTLHRQFPKSEWAARTPYWYR